MPAYFESGILYREPAWHGLGLVLNEKLYDYQEALKLAGADWTVSLKPMYLDETGVSLCPDKVWVCRDDINKYLATVGRKFRPIQNLDAFKFFEPFLHERDCFISTAGVLYGGKKVFITAEIENFDSEIVEGDPVKNFLLLSNSHDDKMKLTVKFVRERVVCANTLEVALAESGVFKSVGHNSRSLFDLQEIQTSIDICKRTFKDSTADFKLLAQKSLKTEEFRSYLERVFESELKDASKRKTTSDEVKLEDLRCTKKIIQFYEEQPDLQIDGVRGTLYGAFNAISQYLTHNKSSNPDSRYNSLWYGSDSLLLRNAKEVALSLT
jgi:phage/plasmid-like protein (TIGR03299 family)